MNEIQVNPNSGIRLRGLYKDCAGDNVTAADVSSASYTVWLKNTWAGTTVAVPNHTNVTIPTSSFIGTPTTDPETGLYYNFSYEVSAKTHPPFPTNNAHYVVEVVTKDLNGEPHTEYIPCFSTMG